MKKSLERFYPALIFLFAIGLYANTISNGYNLSDELVTKNHRNTSKGFDGIAAIFSEFYYEDELGYKYGYRPITQLTFAIEHELLGESPQISHAINVILYAALCTLIFVLLLKIAPTRGPTFALIVSLVFAAHPIHTEAVASIKNRDEILSLLFALSAWLFVFQGVKNRPIWQNIIWMILASLCYYLSIFSKISTLFVVISLPLYFALFKCFKKELIVFIVLATVIAGYRIFEQIESTHIVLLAGLSALLILIVKLGLIKQEVWLKKVNQLVALVQSKKFAYLLLGLAYICLILAVVFGQSLLFASSLFLAVIFLYSVMEWKADNFAYFAWSFPILIVIIIFYQIVLIAFPFFILYSLSSSVKAPKLVAKEFAFFLGLSLISVWQSELLVPLAAIPVLFQLSKKYRSYALLIWLGLNVLLYREISFLLPFYLLFAILIIPQLLERFKEKLWAKKISGKHLLFFVLVIMIHNHLVIRTSDGLKRVAVERIEVEIPVQAEESTKYESSDRPLTYIENPIVENWELSNRLALAVNTNIFYLKKLIFPFPFSFYYGYNQVEVRALSDWQTSGSMLVLVTLLALGLFLFIKGERLAFFALIWMELAILLYSNLFTPVAGIVGERLMFTASFAIAIFFALVVQAFLKNKRLKIPAIVLLFVLLLGATYSVLKRNQNWKDKLSLFAHDIPHLSRSAQANALYADACMLEATSTSDTEQFNRYTELGEKHFRAAVEIYPDFLNWWIDLGKVQKIRGEWAAADSSFQEAREMEPNYTEIYNHLVEIAVRRSDTADIIEYLNYVLFFNPQQTEAMFDLSYWLYTQKDYQQVLNVNDNILDVDNSIPEAYLNKAYAYAMMGDWENFEKQLSYAKLLAPNHPDISILNALKEDLK